MKPRLSEQHIYSILAEFISQARPRTKTDFETPPGYQIQVVFAHFTVKFLDEPELVPRIFIV